jgi:hypothetical protein
MDFIEVTTTDLATVNRIVELSHTLSDTGKVATDRDWEFFKILWNYWTINQKGHYEAFLKETGFYKDYYSAENKHGKAEDKGGAQLQHLNTMPESFHYLFMRYFPEQRMTRDFLRKLNREIPVFNLHKKSHI